jgi:hypothetical protein
VRATARVAPAAVGFAAWVIRLFDGQPGVARIRLVGSRAEGRATSLSDWDFAVDTYRFESVARAMPRLVRPLAPLGTFWDPLSAHRAFIALLPGPKKVDFLFQEPHTPKPPYVAGPNTLTAMDVHFWDWTIWLAAKERGHHPEMVPSELRKMHEYLLLPLGAAEALSTIEEAVGIYRAARSEPERRFRRHVDRELSSECVRFLARAGYAVRGDR